MTILLSTYRMPKKVEQRGRNTFRFSFIRRKIQTVFKSKALKVALLNELYGGKDAALVAQMVDKVSPLVRPPVQVVAPLPPVREGEEEAAAATATAPANPPPPVAPVTQPPLVQPQVVQAPTVPTPGPSSTDGDTAATAVEISDSDSSDDDSD